jgi:Tfp pilus assembly protein PilO
MNRFGRADQLWAIGGIAGAVVLLAIGWFFFINPQYSQTDSLRGEATGTEQRQIALQQRLVELRRQNEDLPRYLAQYALDRQALPTVSGLSDLLRELQRAGDITGVTVGGLSVSGAIPVAITGAQVYALPISLTATGTVATLHEFLNQLQQVQPRALLISGANLVSSGKTGPGADAVSLTLILRAFVGASTGSETVPSTPATSTS